MVFTQIEFIIFLAVVMSFLIVVKHHRTQKLFLLAASFYFYAYWDWRLLFLMIFCISVNYTIGILLKGDKSPSYRKVLLITNLIVCLGILGFFKYYNFFTDSLSSLLSPLGLRITTLRILLPIGISFYTFRLLSYTIDVYRRTLKPCTDFFDFALFVSFFPPLIAGPIVRASDFLCQLETPRQISWQRAFLGFRQFVFGFFKKVFIADRLAFFVDTGFQNAGIMDSATTWLVVIAYTVQIYCDFSGYSDMAIGVARVMGYDFNENFNHPYISTSITEFWRRWHISLSTWLRDYLYIPLGGNRKGPRRMYVNLMITMVLGGLWHGAAWTFVLWGTIHGVALVIHKMLMPYLKFDGISDVGRAIQKAAGWFVTMLVVCIAWVFFRSSTFSQALLMLRQMFMPQGGYGWYYPFAIGIIIYMIISHGISATRFDVLKQMPADKWYTPVTLFSLLYIAIIFYPGKFQPFIYFQF
jgi:alginate O-acetyltransferase complex protein AlgI